MKQHLLAIVVLLGCLLTSCSNTDMADGPQNPATRSSETEVLDLRDFGIVHNKIMDFAQTCVIADSTAIFCLPFAERVNYFHPILKTNIEAFLENTSIQELALEVKGTMDSYKPYYGTYIDEHFMDPIDNLKINGELVKGSDLLEQAINSGRVPKEDLSILKRLIAIAVETDDTTPLPEISDRLQIIMNNSSHINALTRHENLNHMRIKDYKGLLGSICLEIGIYSCNWWTSSYTLQNENSPQRIAPWVAALALRDVRGAIRSSLLHILTCASLGKEVTLYGVGTSAINGALHSSIGGIIKYFL